MNGVAAKVWWIVVAVSLLGLGGALALRWADSAGPARDAASAEEERVVSVASTSRGTLTLTARHAGELDADVAEIAAQASGLLQEVRVRIGDVVKQGELLARVDASEAQQQILEARAQVRIADASQQRVAAELEAARSELRRTEPLAADQLVSAQELDALRATVRALEAQAMTATAQREQAQARIAVLRDLMARARLVAPFDGAVSERYLDPGAVVQAGTKVVRLVRQGPLRVRFRLPEREVARVAVGMPVEVTTQSTGSRHFSGAVTRLSAEISRTDRSLAVEGVLSEEDRALRPGTYAQVLLTYDTLRDVVTVPSAGVVEQVNAKGQASRGVYVVTNGRAGWQPVEVLGRSGDLSAVKGLKQGAQVVTLGQQDLRDGAPVRIEQGG